MNESAYLTEALASPSSKRIIHQIPLDLTRLRDTGLDRALAEVLSEQNADINNATAASQANQQQEQLAALQKLCRICLTPSKPLVNLMSLSKDKELNLWNMIIDIMNDCSLLDVENKLLPQLVCHECKFAIENAYSLKRKCAQSQLNIQQKLQMIKQVTTDHPEELINKEPILINNMKEEEFLCVQDEHNLNKCILPENVTEEEFLPVQDENENMFTGVQNETMEEEQAPSQTELLMDMEVESATTQVDEEFLTITEPPIITSNQCSSETTFNLRLLLLRERSQLYTDKDLREEDRGEGPLQCGLCLVRCSEATWNEHLGEHYGVGWLNGEMPKITRLVIMMMMSVYVKGRNGQQLVCRLCDRPCATAPDMLKHLEHCGTENPTVACPYCNDEIFTYSLEKHVLLSCKMIKKQKDQKLRRTRQIKILKEMKSNTADNKPFNSRLLLLRKWKQLESSEELGKLGKGEGDMQCGLCLGRCTKVSWNAHLAEHYGVGGAMGKEPKRLTHYFILDQVNRYILKNPKKLLRCRICNRLLHSAQGMLRHWRICASRSKQSTSSAELETVETNQNVEACQPVLTYVQPTEEDNEVMAIDSAKEAEINQNVEACQPPTDTEKEVEAIDFVKASETNYNEAERQAPTDTVKEEEAIELEFLPLTETEKEVEALITKEIEAVSSKIIYPKNISLNEAVKDQSEELALMSTYGKDDTDLNSLLKAIKAVTTYKKSIERAANDYKIDKYHLWHYLRTLKSVFEDIEQMSDSSLLAIVGHMVSVEKPILDFNQQQEEILAEYVINFSRLHYGLGLNELDNVIHDFGRRLKVSWPLFWLKYKSTGYGFMTRHKNLASLCSTNQENENKFFEHYIHLMELYQFQPHQIFNMGMMSFSKYGKICRPKDPKNAIQAKVDWLKMALTLNAAGNYLPPFCLLEKVMDEEWMLLNLQQFIKHNNCSLNNRTLLLLEDCTVLSSFEVIDLAAKHGISMIQFPPGSDLIQPFQESAYTYIKQEYNRKMRNFNKVLDMQNIPALATIVIDQVLTSYKIKYGFVKTGIFPIQRTKVPKTRIMP